MGHDDLQTLADGILGGVAENAGGRVVPADDRARVVGRDDRVDRRLGDRAELLLCLFTLADIADDARVVTLVANRPRRQRQLYRHLGAVLRARGELDRRADVFAAGVMIWEAATGQRLWQDLGEATVMMKVLNPKGTG